MSFIHSYILGLIQGITEFIPVSSSGHLAITEHFFHISFDNKNLLVFNIILHTGTLFALIIYFRNTWKNLILDAYNILRNKISFSDTILPQLFIGTIPIIIVGLFFKDIIEDFFNNLIFVFICMGILGFIFIIAEKFPKNKTKKTISIKQSIIIGLFQALAIIPGISRSGATISAGMFQGINRHKAAEFSFLLGTISITAATIYASFSIFDSKSQIPFLFLITGFLTSFISSYFCIHYLLRFLKNHSLIVFSLYLILVSIIGVLFI